jgi:cytochrome c oxidase subunit III
MNHGVTTAAGHHEHDELVDPQTAYEAAKLGMWLFLATEILLFAVMFTCFALFRWKYLDVFHKGSHHLDWRLGSLNTIVLLVSSFTAALAVDAAQKGNKAKLIRSLLITIGCGFIFLIVKTFEYSHKYHDGLFPGGEHFGEYKMFFGLYFAMTGIHGLHVVIGMAVLTWVLLLALRGRFSPQYFTPVEMSVLYWHLVDLIWIYLFPLLYLVG